MTTSTGNSDKTHLFLTPLYPTPLSIATQIDLESFKRLQTQKVIPIK
ncbi:hypothetical protein NSMM_260102 [Nitrosomonas mobilis]|uniref:Uncharacterized protein n=1 Tax=Nitrosomonas mobilis TaxID=51642 RepID=A0A1G5SC81_9PROT|nr:hypothetical protein NSMM_260102 [Nitrosomonas mobilis]